MNNPPDMTYLLNYLIANSDDIAEATEVKAKRVGADIVALTQAIQAFEAMRAALRGIAQYADEMAQEADENSEAHEAFIIIRDTADKAVPR